ncbi:MAG: hypothetical protein PHU63_01915 [Candidatus ainarchaeum sp.]|nr:hypothetical protein [Candidatus ainarchaeum sp.]
MDSLDDLLNVCASSDSHQINLKKKLDLKKLESILSKEFKIIASTPVVLLLKTKEGGISIYQSGKILFKDFDKEKAKEFGTKILLLLGENTK